MPKSPEFILGVINLRGQVLPVFDMRIKLGMPQTEIKYNTCILVLEIGQEQEQHTVGALVDSVAEVLDISPEDVRQPSGVNPKEKENCIDGFYFNEKEYIMLPDMQKLLLADGIVNINAEAVPA